MLRSTFLWLSNRRAIFNFVRRNGLARKFAARFVAGEDLDEAVKATGALNGRDIATSLDLLGESVATRAAAEAARDAAIGILDRIHESGIKANVSLKLTQMGLDIDPDFAAENVSRVLERGKQHGIFVRVDMESSEYVERTLRLFFDRLEPAFGTGVGVVIQSMLRRSAGDIEALVTRGARVRLVKGAYAEPAAVAYPKKADVDQWYATLTERLLDGGHYPAIATHDEQLIDHTTAYASGRGIAPAAFEFQMLYGVRRDLQYALRERGYNVRVYVPFGTEWYPYLMRRLAERPANIAFIVGNVVKETFAKS